MMKTFGAVVLTLTTVGGLAGCAETAGKNSAGGEVVYKVIGTKKAAITYTDGGTKTSQETEAAIPWSKTIKTKSDAIVYQVSAQNGTGSSKRVKCVILLDGKVVDQNVGKGQFAIASCQYTP